MNGLHGLANRAPVKRQLMLLLLVILLGYGAAVVKLPVYLLQPGSAEPVEPLVPFSVPGAGSGGGEEGGRLLLTTVAVHQPTVLELAGALFHSYEVRLISDVRRKGESEQAFMIRQQELMADSWSKAREAVLKLTGGSQEGSELIDSLQQVRGEIGGPSAGLMFGLELYSRLMPGDQTKGYTIAGTGTLNGDGAVGSVGSIRFKVRAAYQAGADVFLVPADYSGEGAAAGFANRAEAVKEAGKLGASLQVVAVSSLEEAVRYLERMPDKPPRP